MDIPASTEEVWLRIIAWAGRPAWPSELGLSMLFWGAFAIGCTWGVAQFYAAHRTRRLREQVARVGTRLDRRSRQLGEARSEVEKLHAQLLTVTLREPVTGLPNRKACLEALDRMLRRMRRASGRRVAVFTVGFEKLQRVSDAYGHAIVDRLLLQAARRIELMLEPQDFLSRVADTQFAMVVTGVRDESGARTLAKLMSEALRKPCEVDNRRFHLEPAVGVVTVESGWQEADEVLKHATFAMSRAAKDGSGLCVFQARTADEVAGRMQLECDLRRAIERQELVMWYQPVFDVRSQAVAGFEALLRWRHPTEGLILPGRFLPIAHESGLVAEITHWVLRDVARQAVEWNTAYGADFFVSANLPAESFSDTNLAGEIAELLAEFAVPPRLLKLEVVESTVIADVARASQLISTLKELGVAVWLDDFGTGYSSLSYLRALAFQGVKLDRSVVARLAVDARDFGLVKTIVDLLHYLEVSCVAEGVETAEQRDILRLAGCDLYQGFLSARPMPAAEAGLLLEQMSAPYPRLAVG